MLYRLATLRKDGVEMKTIVFKATKEILLNGLRKSRWDILKASPGYLSWGVFKIWPVDRERAYRIANILLDSWQGKSREGKDPFPSNPSEIGRYIDIHLAEWSFMDALALINSPFSDRSNFELIKEAQEAIDLLKNFGGDEAKRASGYEWALKQQISGHLIAHS
jgi:hypothetical protein